MLKHLARKWARFVMTHDTRSPVPGCIFMLGGLTLASLYIFRIVPSELLLATSFLPMILGIHLFERCGLLLLLDDCNGKQSTHNR